MNEVPLRILLDANPVAGDLKSGPRRFWTTREIAIVRERYPRGGLAACLELLPGRSASAIYQVARREGAVKVDKGGKPLERNRWSTNAHIDDAIRRAYQGEPNSGAIGRLAAALGRPRRWINARAQVLGIAVPRFKEEEWCEAEIELLKLHAAKHPAVIQRQFSKVGYVRTATAIANKVKRLRIRANASDDGDRYYSVMGLAEAFGCSRDTVSKWIKDGLLKANKPKATALTAKPGDDGLAWRIDRADIKRFVVDNVAAVDFRKVDKFWLVEILAGSAR